MFYKCMIKIYINDCFHHYFRLNFMFFNKYGTPLKVRIEAVTEYDFGQVTLRIHDKNSNNHLEKAYFRI